jgi:hypothetical protein
MKRGRLTEARQPAVSVLDAKSLSCSMESGKVQGMVPSLLLSQQKAPTWTTRTPDQSRRGGGYPATMAIEWRKGHGDRVFIGTAGGRDCYRVSFNAAADMWCLEQQEPLPGGVLLETETHPSKEQAKAAAEEAEHRLRRRQ